MFGQHDEAHTSHDPLPPEGGFMEKLSDLIGSVRGIYLLAAIEATYMVIATILGFDKYPFNFLTLVLSLIALQFSQIIIVVQNRQGEILEEKAAQERQEVSDDLELGRRLMALVVDMHDKLLPHDDPHSVVDVPAEVIERRNI